MSVGVPMRLDEEVVDAGGRAVNGFDDIRLTSFSNLSVARKFSYQSMFNCLLATLVDPFL